MSPNRNALYQICDISPRALDDIRDIVREEMHVIPREPTPEMLNVIGSSYREFAADAWKAMWDVARKPCD